MGQDGAFQEGTTEVTALWIITSVVLSIIGALIGGVLAALISRGRSQTPVRILAGVVLVLGLASAAVQLAKPEPDPNAEPPGEISTMEAMSQARQPTWVAFANPVVGVVGVLAGGALAARCGSGGSGAATKA
jgi:uncharacterized membrane protein YeaQ/YmgE (transglycosylase-associated protein family)